LHSNYQGLNQDRRQRLREIDVDHCASSLGVVLQEISFRGSIRRHDRVPKPDASFEEGFSGALAGAEEFIERPAARYENPSSRRVTNLSERAAAAARRSPRALIGRSAHLILDEATSALDAYSERSIVKRQPAEHAQGRTRAASRTAFPRW